MVMVLLCGLMVLFGVRFSRLLLWFSVCSVMCGWNCVGLLVGDIGFGGMWVVGGGVVMWFCINRFISLVVLVLGRCGSVFSFLGFVLWCNVLS